MARSGVWTTLGSDLPHVAYFQTGLAWVRFALGAWPCIQAPLGGGMVQVWVLARISLFGTPPKKKKEKRKKKGKKKKRIKMGARNFPKHYYNLYFFKVHEYLPNEMGKDTPKSPLLQLCLYVNLCDNDD